MMLREKCESRFLTPSASTAEYNAGYQYMWTEFMKCWI